MTKPAIHGLPDAVAVFDIAAAEGSDPEDGSGIVGSGEEYVGMQACQPGNGISAGAGPGDFAVVNRRVVDGNFGQAVADGQRKRDHLQDDHGSRIESLSPRVMFSFRLTSISSLHTSHFDRAQCTAARREEQVKRTSPPEIKLLAIPPGEPIRLLSLSISSGNMFLSMVVARIELYRGLKNT